MYIILTRMLNSRLFSEKTALTNWILHSAICQSVLPKYSHYHTLKKHKHLMFWGTFLVKWNGAYTKNVTIAFQILISNWCWQFSACASSFTNNHGGNEIYWASANKVLDTFSTIQYMAICCLCHANIIMLSAIWLELSNPRVAPSQVTKMSLRTPDPLFTHTWTFGLPKCACYAVPGLCIQTVSSIAICWLTVKLKEHLASYLPCSSLALLRKPLCPQFPWLCSRLGYNVCQITHRQTWW